MSNVTPNFSLSGLCFQTPGDETDNAMNIMAAMEKLEDFALTGACQVEAVAALAHLER